MDPLIIKKLIDSPEYYNYLKENSEWVKVLKKYPEKYNDFVKYVKKKYHLRAQDKVNNTLSNMQVLSDVLSSIK
ncbi:MAG: hypothetical protein IKX00_02755 [Bacilli bacterium]|nr:hypothetical protein [Bacilli bacterium]